MTKIAKKKIKSAVFEAENPLAFQKWVPIYVNFEKKNSQISHFLREKNPQKWIRVSDLGPHTLSKEKINELKKNKKIMIEYPPPGLGKRHFYNYIFNQF